MSDLVTDLQQAIRGEVRFDRGSRALYATDGSNYRQVPIGVVLPRSADDVIAAIAVCRAHDVPILSRGGGTSLAGQCCNAAVVMDMSKYFNRVLSVDATKRVALVEPGVVLDRVREAANQEGLTFGPDPATHNRCTIGGMLGNDSCGVHSVMSQFYGPGPKTADNTRRLEITTYDGERMWVGPTGEDELSDIIAGGGRRGEIYSALVKLRDAYADCVRKRFPKIPRRVSGFNLDELLPERGFNVARALVGSESTCVTILHAELLLIPNPKARSLVVLGYKDVYAAGDHVPEILPFKPIGLEGMDDLLIENMKEANIHPENAKLLPEGKGWLIVEFGGGSQEEADANAAAMLAAFKSRPGGPDARRYDKKQAEMMWKIRESGLGATAHPPNQPVTWEGWEDSAVPPDKVGGYLRDLRALYNRFDYKGTFYGHFGQGCIHTRIDFDLQSKACIAKYRAFIEAAADLVVSYGGSLSGEHGDGQSRGELLPKMFGPELVDAFRKFKAIWDPAGRMNPGKVVDPYRIDENLRYGADYHPRDPQTHFQWPTDKGSFSHTMMRCVGVGLCRAESGGTMCPSYRVTHEEEHSTRGRARMLWEMMRGEAITDGWQDEHVKESLDLCLACKGCKSDCPVHVDMATYKAEFLSHYYEKHARPAAAYAMGLIHRWAPLGAKIPGLVNAAAHTPGLSMLLKKLGGISTSRSIPRFATQTFIDWYRRRDANSGAGARGNAGAQGDAGARGFSRAEPRVVLWPDTFNNHFHPHTAIAATEVLESAGCEVILPSRRLCCGRALYDYGFLDHAKALLRDTMNGLRPHIDSGTPIVVLEPSCYAVFHDELINLFPNDERAHKLSKQTFLLSEFLRKRLPAYNPPKMSQHVLLHGHCHHKAIAKLDDEEALLRAACPDLEAPDTGCCGMAGSFGFEADHYDVSMKVGELVLLPAVRAAKPDTLIVADGFSCREQIAQATGRRALHLAEVLASGHPNGGRGG
ncbi:MAG TPA: FAD-binding and (Fe-S)-binding domain-containing protein [Vicinamibacterales bacterium]|nr:FAD-binding and (Fe-S)-binding domain-containing protein [Vicinamibacterales bacterium]